jgi:hypothetical protein
MSRLEYFDEPKLKINNANLDYVILLADAKYIARKAGTYTEAERVSIFNTIAILQCAVKEDQQ